MRTKASIVGLVAVNVLGIAACGSGLPNTPNDGGSPGADAIGASSGSGSSSGSSGAGGSSSGVSSSGVSSSGVSSSGVSSSGVSSSGVSSSGVSSSGVSSSGVSSSGVSSSGVSSSSGSGSGSSSGGSPGGSGSGGGKACAWAGTTWSSDLVTCPISGSLCTITHSFSSDGCYESGICATGESFSDVTCNWVTGHWTADNCGTINVVASDGSTMKLVVNGPNVGGVLTIGNYSFTSLSPYSCPSVRPSCAAATPAGAGKCGAGMTCAPDCGQAVGTSVPLACFEAGTGLDGASCKSSSDCAVGMRCLPFSNGLKVCRALCATDQDCSAGYQCLGHANCNGTPAANYCVKLCSDNTKAGSAVCGSGFKCGGLCNSTGVAPQMTCGPAGKGTNGACSGNADCAAGFICLSSTCVEACDTTNDCTAGGTCIGDIFCNSVASGKHYCK
jgi:hypothetical protein